MFESHRDDILLKIPLLEAQIKILLLLKFLTSIQTSDPYLLFKLKDFIITGITFELLYTEINVVTFCESNFLK